MNVEQARNLLPRFLDAIEGMALSGESSLRTRLAWVVEHILVFSDSQIPDELKPKWREFKSILESAPPVPPPMLDHPHYPRNTRTYYLSPAKAKKAAELMGDMFRALVFSVSEGA